MTLLFVFFLSMSFSLLVTPLLINQFIKKNIVDDPDWRRINKTTIPRMGGIVIPLSILLILFSFYRILPDFSLFINGLLIISMCGIIDDIIGLRWKIKLIFQVITAIILVYSLDLNNLSIQLFYFYLPSPISQFLLLLFIVGLINSINFMDGLDGLVAGYSIPIFLSIIFLTINQSNFLFNLIIIATVGSLTGFLKYNVYPAKIFLGDVGSLVLGFLLAYSVLFFISSLHTPENILDLTFPIIILSVPLLDTLKVIVTRILRKQSIFKADKLHLHHILFGEKIKHTNVVFLIHAYSLIFITISFIYLKYSNNIGIILWLIFSVILLLSKKIIRFLLNNYNFYISTRLRKLISIKYITKLEKKLLILSFLPASIVFFKLVSITSQIDEKIIPLFSFIFLTIFVVSQFHKNSIGHIKRFYIYISLILFFLIIFWQNPNNKLFSIKNELLLFASIFMILLILVLMFLKKYIVDEGELLFDGIDFLIIIVTFSIFIINNFLYINELNMIMPILFYAFTFYFWIRLLLKFFTKYSNVITYSALLLPVLVLAILIF